MGCSPLHRTWVGPSGVSICSFVSDRGHADPEVLADGDRPPHPLPAARPRAPLRPALEDTLS